MQKIRPCLWFNGEAEEAAHHYTSIFKNSRIIDVSRYGEGAPFPMGTALTATFEIEGQNFIALNGGPDFPFTESISLYVDCKSQEEVDELWEKLCEGGSEGQCGWLKDKFGVSWQIIPGELQKLMSDPDPVKAGRVMQALFGMKKIEIQGLRDAYEGSA